MRWLVGLLALAGAAWAAEASPLGELRAVHHVRFVRPWEYTWSSQPRMLAEGTLIVARVDPALGRQRQVLQPIAYVDDLPLEILGTSPDGSCLVGLTPYPDLQGRRLYWGPDDLPETVDAERGARALAGASAVAPLDATRLKDRREVELVDHRVMRQHVEALVARCGG